LVKVITRPEAEGTLMTPQPVDSPVISMRAVEKSYGKLEVLRGVDLDVERGSIFALLGSNGAGKTTAVRLLSTLLEADAGTATVMSVGGLAASRWLMVTLGCNAGDEEAPVRAARRAR
jgi:ABC-type Na+ transport system ATPase subunit NatA